MPSYQTGRLEDYNPRFLWFGRVRKSYLDAAQPVLLKPLYVLG
jgi:hypothetical protein